MKICITGVAGFIGSNLSKYFLKRRPDWEIVGVDNLSYGQRENVPSEVIFTKTDVRDKNLADLLNGVDVIFHLAAKNCISDCQVDPVETASINVAGTVNVIDNARKKKVRKIVYAESSALYEGANIFPTPEYEIKPNSFYAISKWSTMLFADAYRRYYGMNITALRYFCVYGPVQDYRRTIPPVISAFIIKLLKGEKPIIYGTGDKRRDFVYVDDVNEFHELCVVDKRTDNCVFNLGSGRSYSIKEIYNIVAELLEIHIEPEYRPDFPGEAFETLSDNKEANKIGWHPKTDLRKGLITSIEYIRGELAKGKIIMNNMEE